MKETGWQKTNSQWYAN